MFTKSVSEIEVRRIASDIDNCRVFNTTLAQPSAVHNVFIDGKYMYMYTYMYMYMYVYVHVCVRYAFCVQLISCLSFCSLQVIHSLSSLI